MHVTLQLTDMGVYSIGRSRGPMDFGIFPLFQGVEQRGLPFFYCL